MLLSLQKNKIKNGYFLELRRKVHNESQKEVSSLEDARKRLDELRQRNLDTLSLEKEAEFSAMRNVMQEKDIKNSFEQAQPNIEQASVVTVNNTKIEVNKQEEIVEERPSHTNLQEETTPNDVLDNVLQRGLSVRTVTAANIETVNQLLERNGVNLERTEEATRRIDNTITAYAQFTEALQRRRGIVRATGGILFTAAIGYYIFRYGMPMRSFFSNALTTTVGPNGGNVNISLSLPSSPTIPSASLPGASSEFIQFLTNNSSTVAVVVGGLLFLLRRGR